MTTKSTLTLDLSNRDQTWLLLPAALADILSNLDVAYIQTDARPTAQAMPTPIVLLTSLVVSSEARLRSALIPLLLRHPKFAQDALEAALILTGEERSTFLCFYSAAMYLQRKFADRLAALGLKTDCLPNQFSAELELPTEADPDEALRHLAICHRQLSGKAINWYGTYEHAAERWLTHMERRRAWAA